LRPGGLVTQWVPLYQTDVATVKSEFATFFKVFPGGTIWGNESENKGYDLVLLGQAAQTRIHLDKLQQRLERADHKRVAESLKEVGFGKAVELLATYAGQGPDLERWLKDAQINRDRNLRLQYLAGMGLNYYNGEIIYDRMMAYRKFP